MSRLVSSFSISVAAKTFTCLALADVSTDNTTTFREQEIHPTDTVICICGTNRMAVSKLDEIESFNKAHLRGECDSHSTRTNCDICTIQMQDGFTFDYRYPQSTTKTVDVGDTLTLSLTEDEDAESGPTHCVFCALDFKENILTTISEDESVRSEILTEYI